MKYEWALTIRKVKGFYGLEIIYENLRARKSNTKFEELKVVHWIIKKSINVLNLILRVMMGHCL
jgi:hypothetical protein